jgi:Bacterial PH domain
VALALIVYGAVRLIAFAQARAAIYTVTTARVILRIGAALPMTYTIPFRCIAAAHLDQRPDGTGTIAIEISQGLHMSYAVLWPHLRPGHGRLPQPAFRCIPDATAVARLLADAAQTKTNEPTLARAMPGVALAAE